MLVEDEEGLRRDGGLRVCDDLAEKLTELWIVSCRAKHVDGLSQTVANGAVDGHAERLRRDGVLVGMTGKRPGLGLGDVGAESGLVDVDEGLALDDEVGEQRRILVPVLLEVVVLLKGLLVDLLRPTVADRLGLVEVEKCASGDLRGEG